MLMGIVGSFKRMSMALSVDFIFVKPNFQSHCHWLVHRSRCLLLNNDCVLIPLLTALVNATQFFQEGMKQIGYSLKDGLSIYCKASKSYATAKDSIDSSRSGSEDLVTTQMSFAAPVEEGLILCFQIFHPYQSL